MSGATTRYPASASAGICGSHERASSGNPCSSTTSGPSVGPSINAWNPMPFDWRRVSATGMAASLSAWGRARAQEEAREPEQDVQPAEPQELQEAAEPSSRHQRSWDAGWDSEEPWNLRACSGS